ncbi:MAG: hypothetical protein WBX38_14090 [Candidatus Sulfotelmatobacter sp.]
MLELRKILSWLFGICFLVFVPAALGSIVRMVNRPYAIPTLRNLLFAVLFSAMATVFGMACISTWRGKSSAKGWGLSASLIYILLSLYSTIRLRRPIWSSFGLLLAVGVAGLVAFSWPYERPKSTAKIDEKTRTPGAGTGNFAKKMVEFLIVAVTVGTYLWWNGWVRAKGVSGHHKWYEVVLILLVVLLITSLHELAHTVTGLALGMKLRAFVVGPFQWRVRQGKWEFQFKVKEILSAEGATGVVPTIALFPRRRYLCVVAAGPLLNLVTGTAALWIAFTAAPRSPVQLLGLLALFGIWSLALFAVNLIPFRTKGHHSDGAIIYQLLSGGPQGDLLGIRRDEP